MFFGFFLFVQLNALIADIPCVAFLVLSFISAFAPKNNQAAASSDSNTNLSSLTASGSTTKLDNHEPVPVRPSPNPSGSDRSSTTRPASMAFTYQAPQTDLANDTLPELLPVFTFLNSQSNKLYQEGYFLKLNDLDTRMLSINPSSGK